MSNFGQYPSHITCSTSPYGDPFDQHAIATAFGNPHGIQSSEDDGGDTHMMQVDQGDINPNARAIQRVSQLLNNESTDHLAQMIENQFFEIFTEEFPVLVPSKKLKAIWEGSSLYDEATVYRSWHSGECSQDGGVGDDDHDSASPIQLASPALNNFQAHDQSQGNMPSGLLRLVSEFEDSDGLDMSINNTTTQNKSFLGSEYGVKKIGKPRYYFQTRSAIDLLDDGYRWRKYGQMGEKKIRPYYLAQYFAPKAVKNNKCFRQKLKEFYEESNGKFLGAQLGVGATAFRSRRHSGWSSQNSGGQVHIIQVDHHISRSIQLAPPPALTDHQIVMASAPSDGSALSHVQRKNEEPPLDILKLAKIFLLISAEEGLALLAIWFSVGASLSASARILLRGAGICSAIGFHSSLGSYILQCVRRAEPAARFLLALGGLASACGFTSVSCLFLPENLMLSFAGVVAIFNIFILPFLFIKKH